MLPAIAYYTVMTYALMVKTETGGERCAYEGVYRFLVEEAQTRYGGRIVEVAELPADGRAIR